MSYHAKSSLWIHDLGGSLSSGLFDLLGLHPKDFVGDSQLSLSQRSELLRGEFQLLLDCIYSTGPKKLEENPNLDPKEIFFFNFLNFRKSDNH